MDKSEKNVEISEGLFELGPGVIIYSKRYHHCDGSYTMEIYDRNGPQGPLQQRIKFLKDGEPIFHEVYYSSGKIHFRRRYKNKKEDGLWESWYENGQQSTVNNYVNGKLHGLQQSFDVNGKIEDLDYYINGEKVSDKVFKEYIKKIGSRIAEELNLDEKSLGNLIASYSE